MPMFNTIIIGSREFKMYGATRTQLRELRIKIYKNISCIHKNALRFTQANSLPRFDTRAVISSRKVLSVHLSKTFLFFKV